MSNNISVSTVKNHTPLPPEGRRKRGQHGWVRLSDEEIERLVIDLGPDEVARCIAHIEEAAQAPNVKYFLRKSYKKI